LCAWSAQHTGIQPKRHVCAWSAQDTARQPKCPRLGRSSVRWMQHGARPTGMACPAPKPGSQAPGVRSPIRHASSLRLGPGGCNLTICPHQTVQFTMKALTWPLQFRTVQFTMNSLTMNSSPRYNETLISFSYS
jgi:hypothetical protein